MSGEGSANKFRVGSRVSQLAMIQTNHVVESLKSAAPGVHIDVVGKSTLGDQVLDRALFKIGDKSLFTKELENSLAEGEVDFVVHSLKDLPTTLPDGMVIGAVLEREDPRDAVIMKSGSVHASLDSLPAGSVVGTSSVRRRAQIRARHPGIQLSDIRGNLNTRLKKLDAEDGEYSALVLAAAGVHRMGWADRITKRLEPDECLHAVGQGALAVECRAGDGRVLDLVASLTHRESVLACVAERAFMRALEGGCSTPVAAHAEVGDGGVIVLHGGVWSIDGSIDRRSSMTKAIPRAASATGLSGSRTFSSVVVAGDVCEAEMEAAEDLGKALADSFLADGAADILKSAREANEK